MVKLIPLCFLIILFCVPAAYSETIKIGALLDLSKEYAMESNAFREGIELAIKKVNSSGGIDGQKIQLVLEDTQYNMRNVATASRKLINLDRVNAAVVGTYTEAMVAGPEFERSKIPLINIWDSAPEIEALGEYVFGIGVWAPGSTDEGVRFIRDTLQSKTAVTVASHGEWSLDIAGTFREKFQAAGGTILGNFETNPGDPDFRTVLLRVRSLAPDVLYAPVTDNISAFWLQLAGSGFDGHVFTSDILNQEILNQLGGVADGAYQTQPVNPSYPATEEMLKAYKEHYKKDCTQELYTSLGYDSIMYLADAMIRKGTDGSAIKDGLYGMANFAGAAGPATMSPEGSVRRMSRVFQVRDSQLVEVE